MDEKKLNAIDHLQAQVEGELEQLQYQVLLRTTFLQALKNERAILEQGTGA